MIKQSVYGNYNKWANENQSINLYELITSNLVKEEKEEKEIKEVKEIKEEKEEKEINKYLLLYCPPPINGSGGITCIYLFFNIAKKLNLRVKFCPLLKNIKSLNFNTPFNNKNIDTITQDEIYNYYFSNKNCILKKEAIVSTEILKNRNNIIIYTEDVIGNPAEQKYVIRWLLYFPIPLSVQYYKFETDYIWIFSDYIYLLYGIICNNLQITDYLSKYLNPYNILRIIDFDYEKYKNINKHQFSRKEICYVDRKFYPPHTFITTPYIQELKKQYRSIMINEMKNNYYIRFGEENINKSIFLKHQKFISYDRSTFLNIIAALNGCISIVKPIPNVDSITWKKDPINKYGIAYGETPDEINHAINTQDKVYDNIYNLFLENENNVKNFIENIQKKFNVNLYI